MTESSWIFTSGHFHSAKTRAYSSKSPTGTPLPLTLGQPVKSVKSFREQEVSFYTGHVFSIAGSVFYMHILNAYISEMYVSEM